LTVEFLDFKNMIEKMTSTTFQTFVFKNNSQQNL